MALLPGAKPVLTKWRVGVDVTLVENNVSYRMHLSIVCLVCINTLVVGICSIFFYLKTCFYYCFFFESFVVTAVGLFCR